MDLQLKGKTAMVAGATRGIGRAIALGLTKEGAHVYCLGRTVGALEELDDEIKKMAGSATLVPLDLSDMDSIDKLGAAIYERHGKLDIVVGNAGTLGPLSPLAHIQEKHFQPVIDLNLTANWRLIRAMDPLLAASDAGRALFVTSGASWKNKPYWGPYGLTKAALNAMVATYAAECEGTSTKANLLNPGPTATRMRAEAMPGEDPQSITQPEEIAKYALDLCSSQLEQTGTIFDVPSQSFMRLMMPESI